MYGRALGARRGGDRRTRRTRQQRNALISSRTLCDSSRVFENADGIRVFCTIFFLALDIARSTQRVERRMRTGLSWVPEPPIHHVENFFGFLLTRARRASDSDRNRANRVLVIRRDVRSRMRIWSPQKGAHDESAERKASAYGR